MDVCTVVIVGSGRAALLHLNAYLMLENQPSTIYVVAGSFVEPGILAVADAHPSVVGLVDKYLIAQVAPDKAVVDICTPAATHGEVLRAMVEAGFSRFLVEKPAATTHEELEWISSSDLRLEVMENYLFSEATQRVLDLINRQEFTPRTLVSFFSKDRVKDSTNLRGFSAGHPPHVFTVELPHQLYLAQAFAGPARIESTFTQDMDVLGDIFPNHGTGVITLSHSSSLSESRKSFHYSCLSSQETVRCFLLQGTDDTTITIHYPTSAPTSSTIASLVSITDKNGHHTEVFPNDNMMKRAIGHYYKVLSSDQPTPPPNKFAATQLMVDALVPG